MPSPKPAKPKKVKQLRSKIGARGGGVRGNGFRTRRVRSYWGKGREPKTPV